MKEGEDKSAMDVWRLAWVIVCILVGILLVGAHVLAFVTRDQGAFANFSSIAGWLVGLVGFTFTIYTIRETQRAAREAQAETQRLTREAQQKIEEAARHAEQAIKDAQEQTSRTLAIIRREVSNSDRASLLVFLKGLQEAAQANAWNRALLLAAECPRLAQRLAEAAGLSADDSLQFRTWADDLRSLERFIRANRTEGQAASLKREHTSMMDALITRLERMEAQWLREALGR